MWMVRAGRKAAFVEEFLEQGLVAFGTGGEARLPLGSSKDEVKRHVERALENRTKTQKVVAAGQIFRFLSEIAVGDRVCTYDPGSRRYCIGSVVDRDGHREHHLGRFRGVDWDLHVARDVLSTATRNSLGAIQALFLVPEPAVKEMLSKAVSIGDDPTQSGSLATPDQANAEDVDDVEEAPSDAYEDIASKAAELIEDAIVGLEWDQAQDLVAGILIAMGYRSTVSPKGADRGVDVFASPDGLGLEEPRIFVEVKHWRGTSMGASEIRSFLGGRQVGDRCLYVSTGGFTKEARYEAERSTIPVTLIDMPRLRELLTEHYAKLDSSTAALIPLQSLYWPSR